MVGESTLLRKSIKSYDRKKLPKVEGRINAFDGFVVLYHFGYHLISVHLKYIYSFFESVDN